MTRTYRLSLRALGGPAEIQLGAEDAAQAEAWGRAAVTELQRIEAKYSRYRADSWVARLNAAAGGEALEADDETLALLAEADTLHRASGGAFDPTCGALRGLWRFGSDATEGYAAPPEPAALAAALARVGWARVERQGRRVRLPEPGMALDLGGIGKEHAVDRACAVLQALGARHALVNLAGDCRALGARPDGQPWSVGIAHPRQADRLLAQLPLQDKAVCTSGDYARGFVHQGRRYSHVLDARSGWPVRHWASVSVVADSAAEAGRLATLALLAQGQGLALLRASGRDFLAVEAEGGAVHHR
jgi:thiamine biosynthesis lipoprotein